MTKKQTVTVTSPVKSIVPVDVTDATFKANPFPFYAQLRAEAPVFPVKLPNIISKQRAWLITRYDDVLNALKDERFAKDRRNAQSRAEIPHAFHSLVRRTLNREDVAKIVAAPLTPRREPRLPASVGARAALEQKSHS